MICSTFVLEKAQIYSFEPVRPHWEDYSNRFLEDAGSDGRIDHRKLAAQAVEGELAREPTQNIGIGFYGRLRELSGHMADRMQQWRATNWRNEMREQFARIREKAPDLNAQFIAHAREYAPELFPELERDTPERGIEHER